MLRMLSKIKIIKQIGNWLCKFCDREKEIRKKTIEILQLETKNAKLEKQNAELEKENFDLQTKLEKQDNIKYDNYFFHETTQNGKKEGPYCPICFKDKRATKDLIFVVKHAKGFQYKCKYCQSSFNVKEEL